MVDKKKAPERASKLISQQRAELPSRYERLQYENMSAQRGQCPTR